MVRRFIQGAVALLVAALLTAPAFAQPSKRYDPGTRTLRDLTDANLRAGYKIFRQVCKSCHNRDNDQARFLYTESKSMRGWNRVFYERYPECYKAGAWKSLSEEEIQQLNDYLFRNAFDAQNVSCFL